MLRLPQTARFGVLKTGIEHGRRVGRIGIPVDLKMLQRLPLVGERMVADSAQPFFVGGDGRLDFGEEHDIFEHSVSRKIRATSRQRHSARALL